MATRDMRSQNRHRQGGVATLLIVMMLLFLVAMVAAYTSRNLIFEQKTASNLWRSVTALEAAEAGVEWTVAMLNAGVVDNTCGTAGPTNSFQQRYLAVDPASGWVTTRARGGVMANADRWPACAFDGASWGNPAFCSCPDAGNGEPAAPPGGIGITPAFRAWLGDATGVAFARPSLLNLKVSGCTRLVASVPGTPGCLDMAPVGALNEGLSSLQVTLALRSGLATIPTAAITARGTVSPAPGGALDPKLNAINGDITTNGITILTGGNVDAAARSRIEAQSLDGLGGIGEMANLTIVDGNSLLRDFTDNVAAPSASAPAPLTSAERMFVYQFGMRRQTYLQQPGLRRCPSTALGGACTAATINALLAQHPNRVIWAEGNVTLTASIGTAAAPVLLIVNGSSLTLSPGVNIVGLVYLTGGPGAAVTTVNLPDSPTSITGALVSETSLVTAYAVATSAANKLTVTYDRTVLQLLRNTYGSWVRLPGSWKDFN